MKAKFLTTLAIAFVVGLAACSPSEVTGVMDVQIQGPGGHSNGAYGRTNALHAAARAIMEIEKALPDAKGVTVTNLNGGNSVNSIAQDGNFRVTLKAKGEKALAEMKDKVRAAVAAGVAAENAFRNAKEGDMTGGVPAQVRFTIK